MSITCRLIFRQIFYRLVGVHDYEKTEQAYACLCEHLNRARRARFIAMDVIRDDGSTVITPHSWASAEEFLETVNIRPDSSGSTAPLGRSPGWS